ncbi:MAG: hypothetical protein CMP39_05475 [Rickettsiales bacterium]|nr:hypothetical protein [Rickettsiales bacterium]|tara:strand:- start:3489 stop:3668 length:180 start_codon:yes stop_codon:yes gene_type:complete
MTLHSSTYKNKKVYVVLKDGTSFVDKFIDKKSGYIFLEKTGKHAKNKVRTMTIFRHQPK